MVLCFLFFSLIQGMISEGHEKLYKERLEERLANSLANPTCPLSAPKVQTEVHSGAWKSFESSLGSRKRLGGLQEYATYYKHSPELTMPEPRRRLQSSSVSTTPMPFVTGNTSNPLK